MPDPKTPRIARAYLAELETALAGISPETRDDILNGVREELGGLSGSDAARRIQELGDPEFIASEARAEAAIADVDLPHVQRLPRWFSVIAALLVMVGGFVIPVVGTIVGLVMVWFSGTWSRKEKWIATLAPLVVAILLLLFGIISSLWQVEQVQPVGGEFHNPVLPMPFDLVTFGVLLVLVVQFGVGVWLLIRAKRAWSVGRVQRGEHRYNPWNLSNFG